MLGVIGVGIAKEFGKVALLLLGIAALVGVVLAIFVYVLLGKANTHIEENPGRYAEPISMVYNIDKAKKIWKS